MALQELHKRYLDGLELSDGSFSSFFKYFLKTFDELAFLASSSTDPTDERKNLQLCLPLNLESNAASKRGSQFSIDLGPLILMNACELEKITVGVLLLYAQVYPYQITSPPFLSDCRKDSPGLPVSCLLLSRTL